MNLMIDLHLHCKARLMTTCTQYMNPKCITFLIYTIMVLITFYYQTQKWISTHSSQFPVSQGNPSRLIWVIISIQQIRKSIWMIFNMFSIQIIQMTGFMVLYLIYNPTSTTNKYKNKMVVWK